MKLSNAFFVIFVLTILSIEAKKKQNKEKMRPDDTIIAGEDPFSEQQHYSEEGEHSTKYDHDAFLGEEQAQKFEQLAPKETKKRLSELFPKIDMDGNLLVTREELEQWMLLNMRKHQNKVTADKMRVMDTNQDGKVSWEEYAVEEGVFDERHPKDLKRKFTTVQSKRKEIHKNRWKYADTDNDNLLTQDELRMMLHPEETPRMTNVLVQEHIDEMDQNGDGLVDLKEFAYPPSDEMIEHENDTMTAFRENFNIFDRNHDSVLNRDEMKAWLMPESQANPAEKEATHLMKEADKNKDNYLTLEEILENYRLFAGARQTDEDTIKTEL